ncbi:MAG TPA: DUF4254 domain-containing protein [Roseateles sp.]|uniref:DUF4254 domain-containing protein n=1 Tax=Roseateles sp. TaxID=1971397 RepID=UPI002EDA74D3
MISLPSSADITAAHDQALAEPPVAAETTDLAGCIAANHFHNRCLWAQEDLARRTLAADAEIVANKRAIDRHNQARNDAIERIDEFLLSALHLVDPQTLASPLPRSTVRGGVRLNSETAGAMLDRISILGLKIAAMREQTLRTDVDDAHRQLCGERLQQLTQQRADLGNCFDELLADARAGRAYFKIYRQFKMYNDPRLNPALVAESK